MKKININSIKLLLFLTGFIYGLTDAQTISPPEIAAKSYLLVDVSAHQVLAERLSSEPVEPASLTKLMTAYVVFDALNKQCPCLHWLGKCPDLECLSIQR
jgi:D-alanyl-D-alanine carboxypeptidase